MRIKAIARICDSAKSAIMLEKWNEGRTNARQFVGDGFAIYPLDGLPYLTEETLPIVFDVPAAKRSEWTVRKIEVKDSIEQALEDNTDSDVQIVPEGITICYAGSALQPFFTPYGIAMIDLDYLKPLKDAGAELAFYARKIGNGGFWVVAKAGFKLLATIMPKNGIVDEALCEKLETIHQACLIELEKKPNKEWEMENP